MKFYLVRWCVCMFPEGGVDLYFDLDISRFPARPKPRVVVKDANALQSANVWSIDGKPVLTAPLKVVPRAVQAIWSWQSGSMGQRHRSDSPALHEHGEPHSRRAPRLKHLRSNRVCALAPKSLVPVITRLHAGSAGCVRPNAAVEHQGRRLLRHRGKRGRWKSST